MPLRELDFSKYHYAIVEYIQYFSVIKMYLLIMHFIYMHLYRNESFTARTLLAAIDHNAHLHRKPLLSKEGNLKYNKVFSKRSKNFRVSVVKKDKEYDYWPSISTSVLQQRKDDKRSILRSTPIPDDHPKNIAPSIAQIPIPRTSDLVEKSLSRYSKE